MRPMPLEVDLVLPGRGAALSGRRVVFTLSRDSGILGLCGPSGSGKTTLLRVMAGLCPKASGVVRVDGVSWLDSNLGTDLPLERRPVAYLPQGVSLFPHMNVRENLVFASRLAESAGFGKRPPSAGRLSGFRSILRGGSLPGWAQEVVELFGVSRLLDKRSGELSGGQAARIALARCFLRSARLYLLDEPFAGVDPEGRAGLGRILAGLLARRKAMALLVTHTPDELCPLAFGMVRLLPEEDGDESPGLPVQQGQMSGTGAKGLLERSGRWE
ncbi:MAG: ATP-binding cassette domain-containing protein [Nitrospiraceae bacterium]|nr:ATP-binding cassette domain-containing protein [Nitrospiraceae bacterium]